MNILLNGDKRHIPDNSSTQDLIDLLQLTGKRLAIEINQEIVPRTTYTRHLLNPEDKIEIVHAIGGG